METYELRTTLSLAVLVLSTVVAGCGYKLPEGDEPIDLASSGMNVRLEVPPGAAVEKRLTGDIELAWGKHNEASLALGRGKAPTGCATRGEVCKVLEEDGASAIIEETVRQKPLRSGIANVAFDDKTLRCTAFGRVEDIRRLLGACKRAKLTGPFEEPSGKTSVSAAAVPAAPMPSLETKTFGEKGKTFTIGVPVGAREDKTPAGGRMYVSSAIPGWADVTVTVNPFPLVKSEDDAVREAKRLDVGGLDTIADKRGAGPETFLVVTAPRGRLGLVNVQVFASDGKRGVHAKCEGTSANKALLDAICTSVRVP